VRELEDLPHLDADARAHRRLGPTVIVDHDAARVADWTLHIDGENQDLSTDRLGRVGPRLR
jgi:hypothetical protein